MDDLGLGGERLELSGHAVIKARADGDEEIAVVHRVVGVGRAMHPQHSQREGVGLREGALAHQRRGGGNGELFSELAHFLMAPGVDGAAPYVEDRARGCIQELRRAGDLHRMPLDGWPVTADLYRGFGGRVIEVATGDVSGQVDHHGAGPASRGDMERLVDHPREVAWVLDQVVVLHHGERDAKGVCFLEGVLADVESGYLTGECHNWDGVHVGVGDPGDEVGGSGAGGADANTDAPGGTRVAIRHMGAALFVARQNVADGRIVKRIIQRQENAAGHSEDGVNPLPQQTVDERLRSCQLWHTSLPTQNLPEPVGSGTWMAGSYLRYVKPHRVRAR